MTAAATLDADTIVAVITQTQDPDLGPLTEEKIRAGLAIKVDPDATCRMFSFDEMAYLTTTHHGVKALADAGVDIGVYESETLTAADVLSGPGDFSGEIILSERPDFTIKWARAPQDSPLFAVLGGCDALDKDVYTHDGTVWVEAVFDC